MKSIQTNLKGKTAMVTGATGGIGREAAMNLAAAGAELVIVGRNRTLTENTAREIAEKTGNPEVDFLVGDLSSQADVRRIAGEFLASGRPLHILLNNAGLIFPSFQESADGIEMTWALNHLGYFLLTNLLLDRIKQSSPARIVNVSSNAHFAVRKFNFDNPEFRGDFRTFPAYAQSKLANILFTRELARRLKGTGVTVNCLHPGFVASSFGKGLGYFRKLYFLIRPFQISVEKGAKTPVYLSASPEVEGISGEYFSRCKISRSSALSGNNEVALKLWELSEKMVSESA